MSDETERDDERLRALARSYHEPPPTPKDAIWAGVQAQRPASAPVRPAEPIDREPEVVVLPFRSRRARWMTWVTAAAALVILGIGIGRVTGRPTATNPALGTVAEGGTAARRRAAIGVATAQHLSRVEALLTGLKVAGADAQYLDLARDLLASTRLLLDSRAVEEARTRVLLEDLELILVQVVQLDPKGGRNDLDLIRDGLEQRQVLPRLWTLTRPGLERTSGAS